MGVAVDRTGSRLSRKQTKGVYDYFYNSSKQELFLNGQLRSCTISDGVMTISGDFSAYKESIKGFVFTKKQ